MLFYRIYWAPGASFTKQLSKNLGLNDFLSEKFTLIPYHKILSLSLRYFMKLAPAQFIKTIYGFYDKIINLTL